MFYVYVYIDPRKQPVTINSHTFCGEPFYVGKGKGKRAWVHLKESGSRVVNTLKHSKIQRIIAAGEAPVIEMLAIDLTEDQALEQEQMWIAAIGTKWNIPAIARGTLTNMTSGGEGYSLSLEHRKQCAHPGEANGMFGKTHTAEAKQRISDFRKTFRHSEETKAEMKRSRNSKPNPRQKDWVVKCPDGLEIPTSDLRQLCKNLNINYQSLFNAYTRNSSPTRGSTKGYRLLSVNATDCEPES